MTDIKEARGLEVVAWLVDEDGSAEQQPLCRLSDATAVIDQLKADNEAYKKLHDWLKVENERLAAMLNQAVSEGILLSDQRDTLRKQLDEATSAYARLADGVPAAMAKYHKCKKQLDGARELLSEPEGNTDPKWADTWREKRDAWLEANKV